MITLNYGEIPTDLTIDEPYDMQLTATDEKLVCDIINQGIDAHLEAIQFVDHGIEGESLGRKRHIAISDSASMRCFLRRLTEVGDKGDENATDLASCIMETLEYEWI